MPNGVALVALVWLLTGCLPHVVSTEQSYLLARRDGASWRVLADDDETYDAFSTDVLGDPYLSRLLGVFNAATKAMLADNMAARAPQTASNMPVILLDSDGSGVIRQVRLVTPREHVNIELALGVGSAGREDLGYAKQRLAWTLGMALYELMGHTPTSDGRTWASPYDTTTPERALQEGFALALDALHAQENPTLVDSLRSRGDIGEELRDRLSLASLVQANAFRVEFALGQPTTEWRTEERALATSGVAATFFLRLLQEAGNGYPQRRMLWFANFPPADVPYAKVLAALAQMPDKRASLGGFVAAYGECFPAEREWVHGLLRQVLADASSIR